MNCPKCGELAGDNDVVCQNCGAALISTSQNQQNSNTYYCEICNEELEFINTYKQWYCYNCQMYVDLPAPTSEPEPETVTEPIPTTITTTPTTITTTATSPELEPETDSEPEEDIEEEPIIADESSIAWDESAEIELDDEEGTSDEEEEQASEDEVDYDEEGTGEELSWDDAVEMDEDETPEHETGLETEKTEDSKTAEPEEPQIGEIPLAIDLPSETELNQPKPEIELDSIELPSIIDEEAIDTVEVVEAVETGELELEIDESAIQSGTGEDTELKKKSMVKLHQAWLKVNNLKGFISKNDRLSELEAELSEALEGKLDAKDAIILADESLEEVAKLEKELKETIHHNVSELFHFVNSKILLARKIGFEMDEIEEELDNTSSLIARSEYHQAMGDLEQLLVRIFELPKTQDEIMIGLDEQSEIIRELLEPRPIAS